LTLAILGVPFALLLGAFVAMVAVVVIAAIHSVPAGIVMLVVFLVYQQVENHILNPVIMSRTGPLWAGRSPPIWAPSCVR
jgi:predicted PurR-regulated permease PerM